MQKAVFLRGEGGEEEADDFHQQPEELVSSTISEKSAKTADLSRGKSRRVSMSQKQFPLVGEFLRRDLYRRRLLLATSAVPDATKLASSR